MNKKIKAILLVTILVALCMSTTFAWVNFSQHMKNEFEGGGSPPGGTTHDDFCQQKKDVYVENWGSKPLIVRIRLDEYMEIGEGAGKKGQYTSEGIFIPDTYNPDNLSAALIPGSNIDEEETWQPHIPVWGEPAVCGPGFHDYWTWTMGGWKYYQKAPSAYKDSHGYVHQDTNEHNGTGPNTKKTLDAVVITMRQWIDMGKPIGEYWVIDEDGWAYWAAPLMPGEATGLLLHRVELTNEPEDRYYYAINVIAQMATKGISGKGDNYGSYENFFSDPGDIDHSATNEAKELLDIITKDIKG